MNQIAVIDAGSSTMLVEIEPEGMPVVLVEVATSGAMGPPGPPGSGGGEGGSSDWADITNKPATFPPTLPIAQSGVTSLVTDQAAQNTAIAGKAPIIHTHAQSEITNLVTDLGAKAPLASPSLTGTPTAPTAAPATNSTQIATTAFVTVAVSGATGGTITEAPNDGNPYARQSLGWNNLADEFAARELTANKGLANGYTPLDASAKIASTYLPSYVDDVLEFANFAALPVTGTVGIIYVTLDTNKTWRWSGAAYIEISSSPGSTDAVPEGSINLYHTTARASAAAPVQSVATRTGNVVLTRSDVGLANVDNTSDANKPVSTAQATAIGLKLDSSTYTAADVLIKVKTVDGATSGLDADLLDAQDGVYYLGRANHTGTQSADTLTDGTTNKAFLATERTKLTGIATGATANSSDATLLARANHTGSQLASSISDFSAAADARVATKIVNKITVASSAPGSPATNDVWIDTT